LEPFSGELGADDVMVAGAEVEDNGVLGLLPSRASTRCTSQALRLVEAPGLVPVVELGHGRRL
jgi:hypothetical protein